MFISMEFAFKAVIYAAAGDTIGHPIHKCTMAASLV